ncbi:SRPBCC family protein [Bacillus infantis]|uniref:SRPBCC family protein n=1 Tax=Bacillus infantis TaxID=324767 RepID=UPI003CF98E48
MPIKTDIIIQAEKSLIWKAWTESDRMTEWFAPEAVIEPEAGGRFELYFNPSDKSSMNTKGCKILCILEEEKLMFEWKGPDAFADLMNDDHNLTYVTVELEDIPEGVHILLIHDGWGESGQWDRAKQWHMAAWDQMLASLKQNIESGKGILCC